MQSHATTIPGSPAGDSVGGELLGGAGKRAASFASGRVCEEDGCTTRLSIYNSRTRCAVHDFDASLMNFRCPTAAPAGDAGLGGPRELTSVTSAERRPAGQRRHAA